MLFIIAREVGISWKKKKMSADIARENGDRLTKPEGEPIINFSGMWKPVILGAARGPRRRASAAGGENGQYNRKM